jgi:hypothetical protein
MLRNHDSILLSKVEHSERVPCTLRLHDSFVERWDSTGPFPVPCSINPITTCLKGLKLLATHEPEKPIKALGEFFLGVPIVSSAVRTPSPSFAAHPSFASTSTQFLKKPYSTDMSLDAFCIERYPRPAERILNCSLSIGSQRPTSRLRLLPVVSTVLFPATGMALSC